MQTRARLFSSEMDLVMRYGEVAGMVHDSYECGHCGKCQGVTDGDSKSPCEKTVQHMPKIVETKRHHSYHSI